MYISRVVITAVHVNDDDTEEDEDEAEDEDEDEDEDEEDDAAPALEYFVDKHSMHTRCKERQFRE
jgi:hypothetical protein